MPPSGEVRMVLRTTAKPRTENDMTTDKKAARRKLSLLELASDLGNVSKASRMIGYSRQQFYEIRRKFQTYGADGLLDRLPGTKGPHPNRVAAEIETAILDHALAHPCHGPMRGGRLLFQRFCPRASGRSSQQLPPHERHGSRDAKPDKRQQLGGSRCSLPSVRAVGG